MCPKVRLPKALRHKYTHKHTACCMVQPEEEKHTDKAMDVETADER